MKATTAPKFFKKSLTPARSRANKKTVLLIKKYQLSHDISLLEEIIDRNLGLVRSIAAKFANQGEPLSDLIQCGYIGLINAINNFDHKKGNQFSTYATHMIAGEIRHFLREARLMKSPRWVRALSSEVDEAVDRLVKKFKRLPKISEIAEELNITEESVLEILKFRKSHYVHSLDEMVEEDGEYPSPERIKSLGYRSFELPVEDKIALYQALDKLSEVEKKVVYYVFYQDLTQTEIGRKLKLTQRTVSRILEKALRNLRQILEKEVW